MTTLPLSKIKRIAKFDPDVHMMNSEAVFTLATATETFIELLAKEVYSHAQSSKRKTLQIRDFEDSLRTVPWLEFLDGALIGWDDECEENENISNNEAENVNADELTDDDANDGIEPMQTVDNGLVENTPVDSVAIDVDRDIDMSDNHDS